MLGSPDFPAQLKHTAHLLHGENYILVKLISFDTFLYFGAIFISGRKYMHNFAVNIEKKSPCNEDPLTPHFYIVKLGFTGVYINFLFLLLNIDCGYSLEPPH